jgi:pimeloyl-ACP methyl ester carboxylesterase
MRKDEAMPGGKFITVRGMKYHYLDWGESGNPAMILLHGIGDNAHVWDAFSREACPFFHVLALDQRGHGRSSHAVPPSYRCEDYVADLAGMIEALGIDRAILAGHSMGALHATSYAAREPGRVAALIHVDIEPCPPEWNKKYLMNLYRDLPDYFCSLEAFVEHQCQNSPYADAARLMPYAVFALSREGDGNYRQTFDRETLRHFDAYDLRASLRDIRCPTLIVRGEESPVMSRNVAQEMSLAVSKGRVAEIPDAAHPVMTDNPGAFQQAVFHFLTEEGLLDKE